VEHSIERYADDLGAVADAAGLDEFPLYTIYVGALESLVFAARTNRITRAVFMEPMLGGPDSLNHSGLRAAYTLIDHDLDLFWRVVVQSVRGWGKSIPTDFFDRNKRDHSPEDIKGRLKASESVDVRELATGVETRCLVVHNRVDDMVAMSDAGALVRLLPNAQLLVNSGSNMRWDPEAILTVKEFLAEETGGTPVAARIAEAPRVLATLSRREAEIMEMIAGGSSNKDIANALVISEGTVTRHVANIYTKLGVHNRVEATTWAVERS